jgi:hypothetical protein
VLRLHHRIAGKSLEPLLPRCNRKTALARLIASGTVKTQRIGQSAAKLLKLAIAMEKVQRLSGGGLALKPA